MKLGTIIAVLFGYVMCMLVGYNIGRKQGGGSEETTNYLKIDSTHYGAPFVEWCHKHKQWEPVDSLWNRIEPSDSTFYIEMERDAAPFKPDTVAADTFEIDWDWRKMEEFCPKHEQFEPLDSLWNRIEPKPVLKVHRFNIPINIPTARATTSHHHLMPL